MCLTRKYYKVPHDTYGSSAYIPSPPRKTRLKAFALLRQGSSVERDMFDVRIVNTYKKTLDDVQTFNGTVQLNKDIAVTDRVCQSNITEHYHPDRELRRYFSNELASELKLKCRPFEDIFTIEAMEEYIRKKNYTAKQKDQICSVKEYMKVIDWLTLLREHWQELYFDDSGNLHMKGLVNPIAKKARFCAFIKYESYPESKRPRNITGASDFDKFILGVVFGEIGHAFFTKPETIKLTPYELRPRVISARLGSSNYVYVLDHTAFESAATADTQSDCEQLIYSSIYPEFTEYAAKYMDPLIFTTGRTDPSLYVVDTSRASGAPNTSLGNSINNYIFIKMVEHQFGATFRFLVEGDDCVINSDIKLNVDEVKDYALENGFDLKMDEVGHYNQSGFLSMRWNNDDFVVDSTEHWKHLVDAISFEPTKVLRRGQLDHKLYWKYQTAKLLSASLLNPKHELIHILFEHSLMWYKTYYGDKKVKMLDKRKQIMLRYNPDINNRSLLERVRKTYHPECYPEIRNEFGYDLRFVKYIRRLLSVRNELAFEKAVILILDVYHVREVKYFNDIETINW